MSQLSNGCIGQWPIKADALLLNSLVCLKQLSVSSCIQGGIFAGLGRVMVLC